jgi:hypothetical protein
MTRMPMYQPVSDRPSEPRYPTDLELALFRRSYSVRQRAMRPYPFLHPDSGASLTEVRHGIGRQNRLTEWQGQQRMGDARFVTKQWREKAAT